MSQETDSAAVKPSTNVPATPADTTPDAATSVNNQVVIPSTLTEDQAKEGTASQTKAADADQSAPNATAKPHRSRAWIGWVVALLILAVAGGYVYSQWPKWQGPAQQIADQVQVPANQVGQVPSADRSFSGTIPSPTPEVKSAMSVPAASTFKLAGQVAGLQTSEVNAAKQASTMIASAMQAKDGQMLYSMLSSELTSVFTQDSVIKAFANSSGPITVQVSGEPQFSGEWARQLVNYTHDGSTSQYYMALHLENGAWKLFGTMPTL